jgi:hypothetical protein
MAAVQRAAGHGQRGDDHGPLHDELRSLAEQLLEEAKHGPQNRDTAMTLLAADTLITFACEAAAGRP